ncbi:MAG TPA: DUF3987 domain-containing protein [Kineosporiaceae bacterium]
MTAVPVSPAHDPHDDDAAAVHAAELEVARARRDLPARDERMFDCYLGRITATVADYTEADPLAVMATLVSACGVWLGPGPHIRAGDDRHPLLVWILVVGRTSAGRKGASWGTAKRLLKAAGPDFAGPGGNIRSGLTSGEGLAELFVVDDPAADPTAPGAKPAHGTGGRGPGGLPPGDVRLLVYEPEWAAVMARMRREGSALSAMLRAAWEGGDLTTLNVKARHAPESHVGIVAHISPEEFAAKVSASDMAGGTYNRFLPVLVARSKFLPLSTGADTHLVDELGAALALRIERAAEFREIGFTPDAERVWRRLYVEFGTDRGASGPVEQFIARAAPNVLRIAAIHAVLDGTPEMRPDHLHAAAALIRYAIASARAVFNAKPATARLLTYITDAGAAGRTKEEIRDDHFQRNTPAREMNDQLSALIEAGHITESKRPRAGGGGGRRATVYVVTQAPPPGVRDLRG